MALTNKFSYENALECANLSNLAYQEEKAFKKLVYTPDVFTASINVDGQKIAAVLQDIQFHPVTDRILHVDFYQIFEDKAIVMDIPVHTVGASKGVMNGGNLRRPYRKLRVKAIPSKLPEDIINNAELFHFRPLINANTSFSFLAFSLVTINSLSRANSS